jgi:galactokinase
MSKTLRELLIAAGMSVAESANKASLFDKALQALQAKGVSGERQVRRLFVPGRIEFLGKHTDYAGGRSLLCAVERGICLVASPRSDDQLRIIDAGHHAQAEFRLRAEIRPIAGHWPNYPMTVARRVARNFPGRLRGADIAFISDLPPAAGLSSSSALVVAFFSLLADLNVLQERQEYQNNIRSCEDLAGYLGAIENGSSFGSLAGDRGVGTFGGSQDHTAMLCARPGALIQYSFCPVRYERTIQLPADHLFVIGVSGLAAEKTGQARDQYNRASAAVSTILHLWRQATGRDDGSLAAAVASAPDALQRLRQLLQRSSRADFSAQSLLDRLEQFLLESNQLIPAVAEALNSNRMAQIGELVDRSQAAAEKWLGNQVPQTIFLARSARELGALAASAFGAGFGGSVWALVKADEAETFSARWAEVYSQRFPGLAARARFFASRAGPALLRC